MFATMLATALALPAAVGSAPAEAPSPIAASPRYAMGARARVPDYVVRVPLPPLRREVALPKVSGPDDPARPLVVIDAGHGGFDGGAKGPGGKTEKALALDLARTLRDELLARGRVRVALTRDDDRFLALGERSGIARRLGADLFLSIHAEAAGNANLDGAGVYTLAARPTDREAEQVANRENAAGQVGRLSTPDNAASQPGQRMLERSAVFARLILREGQGRMRLSPALRKEAGFAVLRRLDIPAVVFQAGNIANARNAASLGSPDGRAAVAKTLARAIDFYFMRLPPER